MMLTRADGDARSIALTCGPDCMPSTFYWPRDIPGRINSSTKCSSTASVFAHRAPRLDNIHIFCDVFIKSAQTTLPSIRFCSCRVDRVLSAPLAGGGYTLMCTFLLRKRQRKMNAFPRNYCVLVSHVHVAFTCACRRHAGPLKTDTQR